MATIPGLGEFSGFTQGVGGFILTPLVWLVGIIVFFVLIFGALLLRRKRKFVYQAIEHVDLGNGKYAINSGYKAGYFGEHIHFKGLFWSGKEVFRVNAGMLEIHNWTDRDFTEINGKRGVLFYRNPQNRNILAPIKAVHYENEELLQEIAPAEFTNISMKIFDDTIKETTPFKNQLLQFVGWAMVVVFAFIIIIFLANWVTTTQANASDLLLQAGDKGVENCKEIATAVAQSFA